MSVLCFSVSLVDECVCCVVSLVDEMVYVLGCFSRRWCMCWVVSLVDEVCVRLFLL